MRILIVDDDEAFRQALSRAFQRRGLLPLLAGNAAEARQAVQEFKPEACVLDLRLGQDSGLRLLPELLALAPGLAVVVLTGYASIATAVEAVKLGARNYLPKPADADEILAALGGDAVGVAVLETVPMSVDRLEWEHIQKVLAEHDGNISETARSLGMHRRTLQRKLQKRPVRR
ncbi:MAG: two-component system response regulator [Moraxellaceae bacterium]|jgi:two-component system response regulator RegA|nr:two-component system response regulator [Moraxellaceae bacterium]